MARPSILPLPDNAVRHILAYVDDMQMNFPASRGNRPFLAAFLRLLYEATGEVFGASTVRKLLQTYAPQYRPSTGTIHKELTLLRESISDSPLSTIQSSQVDPSEVVAVSSPSRDNKNRADRDSTQLTTLIVGLQRTLEQTRQEASHHDRGPDDSLARALESENQRIRAHTEELVRQLEAATEQKIILLQQLEALKAERDTYRKVSEELSAKVAELASAVQKADERTASSHRFALGRIEDATAELRRYKELLANEKVRTAAAMKRYHDELAMSDGLRRALSQRRDPQQSTR